MTSNWKSISNNGIQGGSTQKNIGEVTNAKIRAILSFNGSSVNPQLVEDDQTITIYSYSNNLVTDPGEDGESPELIPYAVDKGRRIQLNTSIDNYNDIILRHIHYREEDLSLVFEDQYDVPCETIDYKLYSDSTIEANPTDGAKKLYKLLDEKHINKSAQRDEYFITKEQLSSIFDS